jgi:hypothetical protein
MNLEQRREKIQRLRDNERELLKQPDLPPDARAEGQRRLRELDEIERDVEAHVREVLLAVQKFEAPALLDGLTTNDAEVRRNLARFRMARGLVESGGPA